MVRFMKKQPRYSLSEITQYRKDLEALTKLQSTTRDKKVYADYGAILAVMREVLEHMLNHIADNGSIARSNWFWKLCNKLERK